MSESCPKLLDLIPKSQEWGVNNREDEEMRNGSYNVDNKKLELRLGLPDDEGWFSKHTLNNNNTNNINHNNSLLSLNFYPNNNNQWPYQTGPSGAVTKESSQHCCTSIVDLEKKSANTAVPNNPQKRAAPAPVVGWPPIRSFRKNLASSSSSKLVSESQEGIQTKPLIEKTAIKNSHKGLFVKINMDGVPIGRKVDLNAYDSYGKLSFAVDELFRGLLAAQRDLSEDEVMDVKQEEQKPITGLLDGSGEYTLVYEDNEGDRMLVGDVPWHMFVSTVKRLRVLKSSDLHTLNHSWNEKGKVQLENASN